MGEETDLLKVGRRRGNNFHLATLLSSQLAKGCTGQDQAVVGIHSTLMAAGHPQYVMLKTACSLWPTDYPYVLKAC